MAAAFTVMDKVLRAVLVEEVKDIFREEGVDMPGVGSEVVVVFVQATVELEEVEGYSGGNGAADEQFSCGGGGGSFNNGTNQQNECCLNSNKHGRVIITFLQ